MITLDTALPNRTHSAQDRVDALVLGRAAAARHRVLRMLDPVAAAEMGSRAWASSAPSADVATGPQSEPKGRAGDIRARVSSLCANATDALADAA